MQINKEVCDELIYKHGESLGVRSDLTKQKANELCERMSLDGEYAYDWHYFAGRVHMKRLKKSKINELIKDKTNETR